MNKIVMCGCTESGVDMIDYLLQNDIKISYFVSLTPSQAKKYSVSGYQSFKELSKKFQIPIYYPKTYSLSDSEDVSFFKKNNFDLLILGGWQRLIPDQILKTLQIGGIGSHGSSELLPKGRGRSPVNWSLIEGKNKFILHLFLMKPGVDDGDIISYEVFDINKWDSCKTLYYKISILQKRMLKDNIPKLIKNNFQKTPQEGEPTFYPKRTPEDGKINWKKSDLELYDFIRAITKPYPGAFTFNDKSRINIWKAQPFDSKIIYAQNQIGEIVEKFSSGDFIVKCAKGSLLVTEYEGDVSLGNIFSN